MELLQRLAAQVTVADQERDTPTFAGGIVRASTSEQLATLRLGVTGAEKYTQRVCQALAQRCPKMVILEAYGLTECSAIVSLGDGARAPAGRPQLSFNRTSQRPVSGSGRMAGAPTPV